MGRPMSYRIVLGDPQTPKAKVVTRDSLNAALHWLGDEWPLSANDMEASVYFEVDTGLFMRVLGICREGVVDMEQVRLGLATFNDHLFAATSPKVGG